MADIFNDNSRVVTKVLDMPVYQVDNTDATKVYMRYKSGLGTVLIVRVSTAANITTYEKTHAAWVDRASAEYVAIDA